MKRKSPTAMIAATDGRRSITHLNLSAVVDWNDITRSNETEHDSSPNAARFMHPPAGNARGYSFATHETIEAGLVIDGATDRLVHHGVSRLQVYPRLQV